MKVEVERLVGPEYAAEAMDITRGIRKGPREMSIETWRKLLRTAHGVPHSPMRAVVYRIRMYDIPSYVATHFARHHVGSQPYISSQRGERAKRELNQTDPVDAIFDVNANSLIDMAKARMCSKADPVANGLIQRIFLRLNCLDEYDSEVAKAMGPPCEIYGQCFEIEPCGKAKVW